MVRRRYWERDHGAYRNKYPYLSRRAIPRRLPVIPRRAPVPSALSERRHVCPSPLKLLKPLAQLILSFTLTALVECCGPHDKESKI